MKYISKIILVIFVFCSAPVYINAAGHFITTQKDASSMTLYEPSLPASILINSGADKGVLRAVNDLQSDFMKVTGAAPQIVDDINGTKSPLIIIGTIGTNSQIDQLVKSKKINGADLKGKNEKYIIQSVSKPFDGVDEALVIAGSDKRGTIYGIYELSRQIGVSPWYYWADVPVEKKDKICAKRNIYGWRTGC